MSTIAFLGGACSRDDAARVPPPARFASVDEVRGRYGPVELGNAVERVRRVFGPKRPASVEEPISPTGARDRYRGPPVLETGDPYAPTTEGDVALRYDDVTFFFVGGRLAAFMITSPGAVTRAGVAVGSPLDEVKRRYPRLRCETANASREYERYPACTGRLAPRRYVWFGGDPVENITIGPRPHDF